MTGYDKIFDILNCFFISPFISFSFPLSIFCFISLVHVVSRATDLPFQIDDAGRSEAEATATGLPVVNQDTALNFRYVYVIRMY